MKREKSTICFLLAVLVLFSGLIGYCSGEKHPENTLIELFVFSPCESCREEEKFEEVLREEVRNAAQEGRYVYRSYNAFREKDRIYIESRLRELGADRSATEALPAAVMDGKLYFGDYRGIAGQLTGNVRPGMADRREKSQEQQGNIERVRSVLEELEETDTDFVLFTTASCDSCRQVKRWMKDNLSDGQEITVEESIMEAEGLALLQAMLRYFAVPDQEQQVPLLFYRDGFLSGEKAICAGIPAVLEQKPYAGKWTEISAEALEKENFFQGQTWWKILIAGFVNGLNPCGISMLLMVLSLLMNTSSGFLRGSLSYLAGKFLAYLLMGTGAFFLFSMVETSGFRRAEQGLTAAFAILALLIGILNLIDFWNVKRKQYGKVIVQLPALLRKKNHRWIEKVKQVPAAFLMPFLFGLGMVISLGDFFCTGQLYAAGVLYMARMQDRISIETLLWLLLYVSAMCLPLLLMILVIQKSRDILAVSRVAVEGMPAIKLISGVLFLILSGLLAASL